MPGSPPETLRAPTAGSPPPRQGAFHVFGRVTPGQDLRAGSPRARNSGRVTPSHVGSPPLVEPSLASPWAKVGQGAVVAARSIARKAWRDNPSPSPLVSQGDSSSLWLGLSARSRADRCLTVTSHEVNRCSSLVVLDRPSPQQRAVQTDRHSHDLVSLTSALRLLPVCVISPPQLVRSTLRHNDR